jgi:hypothetical protein
LVAALCVWLAAGMAAQPARAQRRPYYNITAIDATRVRNGVILTIKADGAMTDAHSHDWMYLSGSRPRPVRQLELHCPTGRSQVGDFVDISLYPISHVELTPRAWANDGIGVNLVVKLYADARIRRFRTPRLEGDWPWRPEDGCCFDGEIGRDKQSFVFTVISDRFAPPDTPRRAPEKQELLLEPGPDGTYSLSCLNVDLRRLAHELGRETGARIVVDESVDRFVTANLPEATVPELLRGIGDGYGLAVEERDGQYVLSHGLPANVATYETNVTRVVKLTHLSPSAALGLLPDFLLAYARPSEAQNALILSGPAQLVRRVREDVAKIDHPPVQVRVDAVAAKVAQAKAWREALELDLHDGRHMVFVSPESGAAAYSYAAEPGADAHAVVRRLLQTGVVDAMARAHVTLANGKWAKLFLGQQRYIQVSRNTRYGDEDVVVPIDLGAELSLGAWTGGREIVLDLRPTITRLGGIDPATNLPVVDRYEARASLRVPDGHTLLLGGIRLTSDSRLAQNAATPGTGPRAGLFGPARTETAEDAEIALFVTARILGQLAQPEDNALTDQLGRAVEAEGLVLRLEPLPRDPEAGQPGRGETEGGVQLSR